VKEAVGVAPDGFFSCLYISQMQENTMAALSQTKTRRKRRDADDFRRDVAAKATAEQQAQEVCDPHLDKLAERIVKELGHAEKAARTTFKHILNAGEALNEAKEKVGHGNWMNFLLDKCRGLSDRSARLYIQLAKNRSLFEDENGNIADFTVRGAIKLLQQPDEDEGNGEDKSEAEIIDEGDNPNEQDKGEDEPESESVKGENGASEVIEGEVTADEVHNGNVAKMESENEPSPEEIEAAAAAKREQYTVSQPVFQKTDQETETKTAGKRKKKSESKDEDEDDSEDDSEENEEVGSIWYPEDPPKKIAADIFEKLTRRKARAVADAILRLVEDM
jgi:hypothetical protein